MPLSQGLTAQLLPFLSYDKLFFWAEIIQMDPDTAKTLLENLRKILEVNTSQGEIESLVIANAGLIDSLRRKNLRKEADAILNELKGFPKEIYAVDSIISNKRRIAAVELLADRQFILLANSIKIHSDSTLFQEFFYNLWRFAKTGSASDEEQMLREFDQVRFINTFKLLEQQAKYLNTHVASKIYQPNWLSRTSAVLFNVILVTPVKILVVNPIFSLLYSINSRDTWVLLEGFKYPINVFLAPFNAVQYGWFIGFRGCFYSFKQVLPELYNRHVFASLAIIALAITSALLITFFPPAAAFVIGLPALGFLAGLSTPLLATVVGVAAGLVLTGLASLATLIARPNRNAYSRLPENSTPHQAASATAGATGSDQPAVHPSLAPVVSSATTAYPQAGTGSVLSTSNPLFSPVSENTINIKVSYDNGSMVRVTDPFKLTKGEDYKDGEFTVMFKQDGTLHIEINKAIEADETYSISLGNSQSEILLVKDGKPNSNLPKSITCSVAPQQTPSP